LSEQNFVDYVKICCRSGRGGAGSTHFYRDRTNPKGGPDGGNGGRGGHVIFVGNNQMWTLLHLKYRKHVIASNAENGSGNQKTGADGQDVILEVPLGTVIKDADSNEIQCEITNHDQKYVAVKGGRGGRGNMHFKSATNQAPRYAQPGEPGKEEWKILELKVLADVGLVGFPNAGKSTLLSVVTAAKPKIANYPFTTLKPNLGIVSYRNGRSFVMADIPGIIEKAHQGKGLGIRFLRHIERNSVLLFIVSADSDNIKSEYKTLLYELKMYSPELLDKPRFLGISKCDLIDDELEKMIAEDLPEDIAYLFFSSATQYNIDLLKDRLWEIITTS